MPDESVPTAQTSTPPPNPPPVISPPATAASPVAAILGAVMAGSFWLPWMKILGFHQLSGMDFANSQPSCKVLWLIPAGGFVSVLSSLSKPSVPALAAAMGLLPWMALAYGLFDSGKELLNILQVGAYFTLGAGALLLLSAKQSGK